MKKNLLKSGLAVGIIAFFVGASVISGVGGDAKDLGLKDEENSMTVWDGINYKSNNVTLCGYTIYEEGDPAPIDYVELTNLDSGQKYYPDFEDNFWHKELILGEDIWINATLEIYVEDCTGVNTNTSQRIFTEIDLVNWWNLTLGPEIPPPICGDVNWDGIYNVGDIVYLINYLYRNGPPPIPCVCVGDVNCDGKVDLGDIVYLINCLYRSIFPCEPCQDCCNPPWGC